MSPECAGYSKRWRLPACNGRRTSAGGQVVYICPGETGSTNKLRLAPDLLNQVWLCPVQYSVKFSRWKKAALLNAGTWHGLSSQPRQSFPAMRNSSRIDNYAAANGVDESPTSTPISGRKIIPLDIELRHIRPSCESGSDRVRWIHRMVDASLEPLNP
jgi:hypothetical protein